MKQIKGPWKSSGNEVWTDHGMPFKIATATVASPMNGIDADGHARLIAAAPDLIEAARAVLKLLDGADIPDNGELSGAAITDALRAAVDKATVAP